jgi:hypothetical protein
MRSLSISIPDDSLLVHSIRPGRVLVSPVPASRVACSMVEFRKGIQPFDPAEVRTGDRIGNLTVIAEPVATETRIHGFPCRCTWGFPPVNVKTGEPEYPPWCAETVTEWFADCRCDCGIIVPRVKLAGHSGQRVSCGCHYGQPPDHWNAQKLWGFNGAYRPGCERAVA